eukprot:TRINITY_DN1249_c0_g1_i1.p1 TRINITY_DN1249_c0_g1~~TRINITY_DN1249_c0_g1_i1.p1  ORF type:complete len:671 (+),score=118.12 TRINITY_DN1249_c0_g1_i1:63-2075(+)
MREQYNASGRPEMVDESPVGMLQALRMERSSPSFGEEHLPNGKAGWNKPLMTVDEEDVMISVESLDSCDRSVTSADSDAKTKTSSNKPSTHLLSTAPQESELHMLSRACEMVRESHEALMADLSKLTNNDIVITLGVPPPNCYFTIDSEAEQMAEHGIKTQSLAESRFRDILGESTTLVVPCDRSLASLRLGGGEMGRTMSRRPSSKQKCVAKAVSSRAVEEAAEAAFSKSTGSDSHKSEPSQATKSTILQKPSNQASGSRGSLRTRHKIPHASSGLLAIVHAWPFELIFAILIAINAFTMCLEAQYDGFEAAYKLGYGPAPKPANQVWPHAHLLFQAMEFGFGVAFTLEVLVKICALQTLFLYSVWNWFDAVIILLWVVNSLNAMHVGMNPMFLRVARLGRLLRLLRFVKAFQVFDVLVLLIESVRACASVLVWSLLLLFLCMFVCTLLMNYGLQPVICDPSLPADHAAQLYEYFGTFTRGLLSMYEITMGNYVPISRTLHELVSEWFLPIILGYRCLVSFALIKVISGIFLSETLRVASSNDEIMIMQKERAMRRHVTKMKQLFAEADESGDGELTFEEFKGIMEDARVTTWLAAQDLEVRDVELVFQLVDNGTGVITAEELVVGFAQLKGPARSIDMLTLLRALTRLEQDVARLNNAMPIGEVKLPA